MDTDCIGSYKSNYHTITTTTVTSNGTLLGVSALLKEQNLLKKIQRTLTFNLRLSVPAAVERNEFHGDKAFYYCQIYTNDESPRGNTPRVDNV